MEDFEFIQEKKNPVTAVALLPQSERKTLNIKRSLQQFKPYLYGLVYLHFPHTLLLFVAFSI